MRTSCEICKDAPTDSRFGYGCMCLCTDILNGDAPSLLEAMRKEIDARGGLAEAFKDHEKEHPPTDEHRSSCETCEETALLMRLMRAPTIKRWTGNDPLQR